MEFLFKGYISSVILLGLCVVALYSISQAIRGITVILSYYQVETSVKIKILFIPILVFIASIFCIVFIQTRGFESNHNERELVRKYMYGYMKDNDTIEGFDNEKAVNEAIENNYLIKEMRIVEGSDINSSMVEVQATSRGIEKKEMIFFLIKIEDKWRIEKVE